MSKKLSLILLLFLLLLNNVKTVKAFYQEPVFFTQDEYFLHTIERGQTVYSLSVMYNVAEEDIYRLNPESKKVIRAGEFLKIPQKSSSYIFHTIQPQETLYGLSKKYDVKDEDIIAVNPGLSVETFFKGKIIRIPTNLVTQHIQAGNGALNSSDINSLISQAFSRKEASIIKVALLLPFGTIDASVQKAVQTLMVEYLEGLLLALREMKKDGIMVDLQVYDTGSSTTEIRSILDKREMQDVHLIIGGHYDEHIRMLSRFSRENDIPYVIPFTSQSNEPLYNPNVYQINTPQSMLNYKASLAFIDKYAGDNIIIVSDGSSNKKEFIDILKQDLDDRWIRYKTMTLNSNFFNEVDTLLSKNQRNVIVPADDSAETLGKITAPLKSIVDNNPNMYLSLFGYQDWQKHSANYSDDFFRLNTTFYTVYYSDPISQEMRDFYALFYKWYSRTLENYFPKFGMLGYDTGMYFIRLINTYGTKFEANINDSNYKGIQTDFHFERVNNWGGFINMNMYFVNFNPDYTITKNRIK